MKTVYTCARPVYTCGEWLYRIDYFRGVITGRNWQGKEYFRASDMAAAVSMCRVRCSKLGLNFDVHLGVPLPMNYEKTD